MSGGGAARNAAHEKTPSQQSDTPMDADLRMIVDRWLALPADVRKMIVGVVTLTVTATNNPETKP